MNTEATVQWAHSYEAKNPQKKLQNVREIIWTRLDFSKEGIIEMRKKDISHHLGKFCLGSSSVTTQQAPVSYIKLLKNPINNTNSIHI